MLDPIDSWSGGNKKPREENSEAVDDLNSLLSKNTVESFRPLNEFGLFRFLVEYICRNVHRAVRCIDLKLEEMRIGIKRHLRVVAHRCFLVLC